MDSYTTIAELKNLVQKFTQERDWDKFLCPKTISIYLSLEASELLEKFVFVDNQDSEQKLIENKDEIKQELSDIFYWVMQMCWKYDIDFSSAFRQKIEINTKKYPVEKAKGNTLKYNQL